MGRAKFELASEDIRREVDAILARLGRTSKRQQQALTETLWEIKQAWPIGERGTKSDAVLLQKIDRAIMTGRISADECRSIAERMFGHQHREYYDPSMFELEVVLKTVK